ncbi:MAG: hypothetical protein HY072_10640 [Deltaproteobacteria bacterium]|nr:hypothetical protein [Deltaproteobacteria bacterium]
MKDIAKNLTPTGQAEAQLPALGKTTIAAIGNTNENRLFYNKTSSRYLYRSPDSIAEDKSINLFDRVSSRYELFYRKILLSK